MLCLFGLQGQNLNLGMMSCWNPLRITNSCEINMDISSKWQRYYSVFWTRGFSNTWHFPPLKSVLFEFAVKAFTTWTSIFVVVEEFLQLPHQIDVRARGGRRAEAECRRWVKRGRIEKRLLSGSCCAPCYFTANKMSGWHENVPLTQSTNSQVAGWRLNLITQKKHNRIISRFPDFL